MQLTQTPSTTMEAAGLAAVPKTLTTTGSSRCRTSWLRCPNSVASRLHRRCGRRRPSHRERLLGHPVRLRELLLMRRPGRDPLQHCVPNTERAPAGLPPTESSDVKSDVQSTRIEVPEHQARRPRTPGCRGSNHLDKASSRQGLRTPSRCCRRPRLWGRRRGTLALASSQSASLKA